MVGAQIEHAASNFCSLNPGVVVLFRGRIGDPLNGWKSLLPETFLERRGEGEGIITKRK